MPIKYYVGYRAKSLAPQRFRERLRPLLRRQMADVVELADLVVVEEVVLCAETSLISFGSYIANYREERLLTHQTLPNEMRTTTRNGMSNDHRQPFNQTLRTTTSAPITKPSTRAPKYEGGMRRV